MVYRMNMAVVRGSVRIQIQIGIRKPVQRAVGVRGTVHITAFIYKYPLVFK